MPSLTSDQFEAAVRSNKVGTLYLLDGPENWLKERIVKQLIQQLVPAEARDFNFEKFDGSEASAGDIISSAQSLPFLSERRLIIVRAAEEFKAAEGRLISETLPNLPKSTCLVFLYEGKANLREELPATVSSHGAIVTYWTPFPNQLPRWVTAEAKLRGKVITYDAAEELAEACPDLQEISNELDKLALFVGKKPSIDADDIEAHGLPDASGDQRSLEAAVYARDLKEALHQASMMSTAGVRGEMMFPTFERIFRQLLLAFFYMKEKGESLDGVYSILKMRGKTQQSQLSQGLRTYQPVEVQRAFDALARAERDLKTGLLPSEIAVSLFLVSVVGKRKESLNFR